LSSALVQTDRLVTVRISDLAISGDPAETIITYALGSCIAVLLWDPKVKLAGLLHYMLPTAKGSADPNKPPAMFADSGIPLLFEKMYARGATKENIVVKVAGGAAMGGPDLFEIGNRNVTALRKIFWKNGVLIAAEDVGGSSSRTVSIEVATGLVTVRTPEGARNL
jgi:chemotaxis protein CheD